MPTFDENPILNSPYFPPARHWKLGDNGLPTGEQGDGRRASAFLVPVPPAKKGRTTLQGTLVENESKANTLVNSIRALVKEWRESPPEKWNVSEVTRRLLLHWREGDEEEGPHPRLFFCQLEAAETMIWLNEVAPQTKKGSDLLDEIRESNEDANPLLFRLAAKMATGAGKTTVMAMLIAYHTLNKNSAPRSTKFASAFLVVTPGITIRDRLRVLLPHDPENYYEKRRLVPSGMLDKVKSAIVVIQNYHAFQHRKTRKLSKAAKAILRGNDKDAPLWLETDGQMLKRACGAILEHKDKEAVVLSDEAHHCYRRRAGEVPAEPLTSEEEEEIKQSDEAARLWISGVEALGSRVSLRAVYDLSATPFFLRGSGYEEGDLFPWTVSDFDLVEAIESGIVKLPRVPIDDGSSTAMPVNRNLYPRIRDRLPDNDEEEWDPDDLPTELIGALESLYGNYAKTFAVWEKADIGFPPVFIIVCNNTLVSKVVCEYVAGYRHPKGDGRWVGGKLKLFSNVENGAPLARPRTLLVDSRQLESGEGLRDDFKKVAADEIAAFKREIRVRVHDRDVEKITDSDLLREVMNTVGKEGKLGEQIRCVVSVSMLTEGWDANNVTHILGVRAFGTQLLCEQVVGRALRRLNYDLKENGLLEVEYANVFGVPFSFTKGVVVAPPKAPKRRVRVYAIPERHAMEIRFPRIRGYKIAPPGSCLRARFDENSHLTITADMAPPINQTAGIIGEDVMITLDELQNRRESEAAFRLAALTAKRYYADKEGAISPSRFRDLLPIVRKWMRECLICRDGTFPQYLLWRAVAEKAAERIYRACVSEDGEGRMLPMPDLFNPNGSTNKVNFLTTKTRLHDSEKSHINIAVCDSDWELEFCQILESDPGVFAWARNVGMGFDAPYTDDDKISRMYRPDFIAKIGGDGDVPDGMLNLVVEIKGIKDGHDQAKADTMNRLWVPAVNNDGRWGRWAFLEITDMQKARALLEKFTRPSAVGGGKHRVHSKRSVLR